MLSFVRKKAVSFSGTWIPVPRVEREFSENHASTAPAFFRRDRSRLPESECHRAADAPRDPIEELEPRHRSTRFDLGDRGLRGADPGRELGLGEANLPAKAFDYLTDLNKFHG